MVFNNLIVYICIEMWKIRLKISLIFIFLQAFSFRVQIFCQETSLSGEEFIKGVDLSVLYTIEANGGIYKENGIPKDGLQIFKDHNINFIRLRLWHNPANGYNNLNETLIMADRIKSMGFKLLLDFHYSDTWADPGHQSKPSAWLGLSFQSLKDSVYQYTSDVILALKNQNLLPDIVQIGNEITCGMLWDDGRVCDQFNTPQQWSQLAELINEAVRGINESIDINDTVKIMIHIDRGGDNAGSQWFYGNLIAQNVDFDIIGLSYYPWWQGTLSELEFNINDLSQRYDKEVIVVETAYPWTLDWYDSTHNIVGTAGQLHSGYPATVDGQKNFLYDLMNLIRQVPESKGLGFFYWAPEWITTPSFGSPWENVTLFDFSGELLSSISVFDSIASGTETDEDHYYSFNLYQNYPNPFNPKTIIQYSIPNPDFVKLIVYDLLGNEIVRLVNEYKNTGTYSVEFDGKNFPSGVSTRGGYASGVYFYRIQSGNFIDTKKLILLR
jgi:arabinogalactan endo-1,4-beta-galactosidase